MKKLILSLILFLIFLNQQFVFADIITVDSPPEVQIDDIFTADIKINTTITKGVTFDLTYDNSVLSAETLSESLFISSCKPYILKNNLNNSIGRVEFDFGCMSGTLTGEGSLAKIKFRAISIGTSRLSLSDVGISDASAQPIPSVKIKSSEVVIKGIGSHEKEVNKELPGANGVEDATRVETGVEIRDIIHNMSNRRMDDEIKDESTDESMNQSLLQEDNKKEYKNNITIRNNVSENYSITKNAPKTQELIKEHPNQTYVPEKQEKHKPKNNSHGLWIIILIVLILFIIYIIYNIINE